MNCATALVPSGIERQPEFENDLVIRIVHLSLYSSIITLSMSDIAVYSHLHVVADVRSR